MCLFGGIFNIGRLINASILLADVARHGIARSFLFEIPWIFGMASLSSYFFGVFHTLANSNKVIYKGWVGSQFTLDLICVIMLSSPLFTTIPSSIIAGHYAQVGNLYMASIWTSINYYFWVAHDFLIGTSILLSGLRLLKLLKQHLNSQGNRQENIAKIKLGATKVKIIIFIGCNCLWGYGTFMCYYAVSRNQVMHSYTATVVMACLTLYTGPLCSSVVLCALFLNIKVLNGFSHLSLGSSGNVKSPGNTNADTSQRFTSHMMDSKGDNHLNSSLQLEQWSKTLTNTQDGTSSFQLQKRESFDFNGIRELELQQQKELEKGIEIEHYQSNNHSLPSTFPNQQNHSTIIEMGSNTNNNNNNHRKNEVMNLEQEQYHYNVMTNQIRSSPPHRHHNQPSTILDDNDSNTSSILTTHGNVSASNLVNHSYK
ncbi:unnamed protein product [Cunninghamella blakesleeana]